MRAVAPDDASEPRKGTEPQEGAEPRKGPEPQEEPEPQDAAKPREDPDAQVALGLGKAPEPQEEPEPQEAADAVAPREDPDAQDVPSPGPSAPSDSAEERLEEAEQELRRDDLQADRDHRRRQLGFWVVVAVAAVLAVVLGLDLFAMPGDLVRAAGGSDQAQAGDVSADGQAADQNGGDAAEDQEGVFSAQGVTLQRPRDWTEVSSGSVAGLQAPKGVGYIQVTEQNASTMTMGGSVDGSQAMEGFVATMIQSEGLDVDAASVKIVQGPDGFWRATLPFSQVVDGTACKGSQLLAADGERAYVVTALCPDASYQADWATYQAVLDSAAFEPGDAS